MPPLCLLSMKQAHYHWNTSNSSSTGFVENKSKGLSLGIWKYGHPIQAGNQLSGSDPDYFRLEHNCWVLNKK